RGGGFLVGELAFGAVGPAAGRQDAGGAGVPRDGGGGVVGAAGAQDQDGPAGEVHPVPPAEPGKAHIVGVVAVQPAVPVDHRVHRADGGGPGVDIVAVFHHQPLIGDGD